MPPAFRRPPYAPTENPDRSAPSPDWSSSSLAPKRVGHSDTNMGLLTKMLPFAAAGAVGLFIWSMSSDDPKPPKPPKPTKPKPVKPRKRKKAKSRKAPPSEPEEPQFVEAVLPVAPSVPPPVPVSSPAAPLSNSSDPPPSLITESASPKS